MRLYEVYETPDNVFLVLENCACGDLEKMMYIRGWVASLEPLFLAARTIVRLIVLGEITMVTMVHGCQRDVRRGVAAQRHIS